MKEAAAANSWLMSEQTLDKQVVQQLDFTKNLQERRHLFLEVCKSSSLFLKTRAGWGQLMCTCFASLLLLDSAAGLLLSWVFTNFAIVGMHVCALHRPSLDALFCCLPWVP